MKKFFPLCLILVLVFSWSLVYADKIDAPVAPNLSNVGDPVPVIEKAKIVEEENTSLTATRPDDMSERGANKNPSPQPIILDTQDYAGSETFDASLGEFTNYTVSGVGWIWDAVEGNPAGCAFYDDASGAQDAYLVSTGTYVVPDVDDISLLWDQRDDFGTWNTLTEVLVATDFTGDPSTATWSVLWSGVAASSWETMSADLAAYRGIAANFAFHYVGDYSDEWHVDNVMVMPYVAPSTFCDINYPGNVPPNDDCSAVPPTVLASGVPTVFSGNNCGATPETGLLAPYGVTWESFTINDASSVVLEYCGSAADPQLWGNVFIIIGNDCPFTTYTFFDSYNFTDCVDGTFTGYFDNLAAGTYYYPVMLDEAFGSEGPYTLTVTATTYVPPVVDFTVTAPGTWNSTTCAALNDCDLRASEDHIYEITIPNDGIWTFSLCNTAVSWDTWIALGTGSCSDDIAINDDFCGGMSEINEIALTAGTYYLTIEAFGSTTCGDYTLDITEGVPCVVTCPTPNIPEGEPICYDDYVDATNGGCNSVPEVFQTWDFVTDPTMCGTSGTFLNAGADNRDTDWINVTTTEFGSLSFTVEAEFDAMLYIFDFNNICVDFLAVAGPIYPGDCEVVTITASQLPAGTYTFWIGPSVFTGVPCGAAWYATAAFTPETPTICLTSYSNCDLPDDWMTLVEFGTIYNATIEEGCPDSYGDYTAMSTDVAQFGVYPLSVTFESGTYTQYVYAAFDWNQDLSFDPAEIYFIGSGSSTTLTADITVPGTALAGPTVMRVFEEWTNVGDPCNTANNSYGEAEDYTVNVTAGAPPIFGVAPGAVNGTAPEGGSDSAILTVSNTGAAELVFTADVVMNPPAIASYVPMNSDDNSSIRNILPVKPIDNVKRVPYPGVTLQGGDTYDVATVISAIPFTADGTTIGFVDDYDEICPYTGTGAPDVVYSYTPAVDEYISLTLCGGITDFDTKMYMYENAVTPGAPYECNDDFCSAPFAYVSQLDDIFVTGGNTYFIVVDGYGAGEGNYTLDIQYGIAPPEPEGCPTDGTLLAGQAPSTPDDSWSFGATDIEWFQGTLQRWDSFTAYGTVDELHWWGLTTAMDGSWAPCDEGTPESFEVVFYEDDGGVPGAVTNTFDVTVTPTFTGVIYAGTYDMKRWELVFSPAVPVWGNGWVSILGTGDITNLCGFLWGSAGAGAGFGSSLYEVAGGGILAADYDLSYCLIGSPATEWLSIDNNGGSVPAGGSVDVTVDMDATDLTAGTYNGSVLFTSNDPSTPTASVPVEFIVTGGGACDYVVGDINGSGSLNGLDVTYGVAYFKGGNPPPYTCECTPGDTWFVSSDANGSCSFNGLDITFLVSYFKGGNSPVPCGDCPPGPGVTVVKTIQIGSSK